MSVIRHLFMCCFALFGVWAQSASAQSAPVTLSFADKSFSIDGTLSDFTSDYYTIETEIGVLTMATATTMCTGAGCPDLKKLIPNIKIAVSPELSDPLIPALIENFAVSRGYRIFAKVSEVGSVIIELNSPSNARTMAIFELELLDGTESFKALATGQVRIAALRRGPTLEELDYFNAQTSSSLTSQVIGWEALRLYTERDGSANALSMKQLLAMTSKDGATWPGTSDEVVQIEGDNDTIIAFHQILDRTVESPALAKARKLSSGTLKISPNYALPAKYIPVSASCGEPVFVEEIENENHPLRSPIYLFHKDIRLPAIGRDFLRYVLSVPAQRVVDRAGFISRTPLETRLDSDQSILLDAILNSGGDVRLVDLKKAVRTLSQFGRLSLTFRYKEGTRSLDQVSKSNLKFLAELLQQGRFQNRDVLFAGFSDSVGNSESNLRLSLSRAETLRDSIINIMGENAPDKNLFRAKGFGEVLPLACNDIAWGQHQNRRVEIWVR